MLFVSLDATEFEQEACCGADEHFKIFRCLQRLTTQRCESADAGFALDYCFVSCVGGADIVHYYAMFSGMLACSYLNARDTLNELFFRACGVFAGYKYQLAAWLMTGLVLQGLLDCGYCVWLGVFDSN